MAATQTQIFRFINRISHIPRLHSDLREITIVRDIENGRHSVVSRKIDL